MLKSRYYLCWEKKFDRVSYFKELLNIKPQGMIGSMASNFQWKVKPWRSLWVGRMPIVANISQQLGASKVHLK